jgi:hypothetical protein
MELEGGSSVNVSPSVVRALLVATVGSVTVSLPMITTPELDTIVWPSGKVVVSGPEGTEVGKVVEWG